MHKQVVYFLAETKKKVKISRTHWIRMVKLSGFFGKINA